VAAAQGSCRRQSRQRRGSARGHCAVQVCAAWAGEGLLGPLLSQSSAALLLCRCCSLPTAAAAASAGAGSAGAASAGAASAGAGSAGRGSPALCLLLQQLACSQRSPQLLHRAVLALAAAAGLRLRPALRRAPSCTSASRRGLLAAARACSCACSLCLCCSLCCSPGIGPGAHNGSCARHGRGRRCMRCRHSEGALASAAGHCCSCSSCCCACAAAAAGGCCLCL
jgi:hypothetical protein